MDIVRARLYVTTKYIYASGNLFGKWMILSDYSNIDEFDAAFKHLYKDDDLNPELELLAWQDVPACLLIEKRTVSAKIFKFIRIVSTFDKYHKRAFHVWLELMSRQIPMYTDNEFISSFNRTYRGYFHRKEDFGRHYAYDKLGINNPDFNYEQFTKQLFEDRFIHANGFVFSKMEY